jgi:branched-subunit amino acid aminotransferase/4-amino-4-deoxychorismate lyase
VEPIARINDRLVPISQAAVSLFDLGLVQGAAVTEMIRTFAHRPFRLDAHLDRLLRSVRAVGFPVDPSVAELRAKTLEVVEHNARLIPAGHDLGIVLFVTAGLNLTYVGAAGAGSARTPTLCIHTFPLPFELWAEKYDAGQHLVVPSVRHVPPDCIDPQIKMRSRMHWYLADRQARLVDPHASALLLDHEGRITETSAANFLLVEGGAVHVPGGSGTLGGLSLQVVSELCGRLGIPFVPRTLRPYDVANADEACTSSTPYCLLPVTRFDGRPIGDGRPGPVFRRLIAAWNDLAGLDIIAQMRTGAAERRAAAS